MARSQGASQLDEARSNEGLPRSEPPNTTILAPAQTEPKPASKLTYGRTALLTLGLMLALLTVGLLLTLGWASLLGWLVTRLIPSLLS